MPEKIAGTEIYTLNLAKGLQKRGHEVFILIPNFDVTQNETYYFEEVKVIKFAENTPVRRAVLTGMIAPEGVANFRSTLEQEKPDFIHFQDMTGSRGISMYHVKAAKKPGSRTLITMHLSGYTCDTGLLFRKGSVLCDGRVEVEKCAACSLKHSANKDGIVNYVLVKLGSLMNKLGIDPRKWHNRLGTSLGFPSRIQQKLKEISGFSASFDQIISITEWYRAILLLNDVPADKITYIPQALPSLNDKEHDNVSEVPASSSMVRLLFVGRIIPLKGLDLLLSAVKKLPQEKFSLTIIGKKDDPLYFEKCIRLAENQSNIFWKGPVDDRAELSPNTGAMMLCVCRRLTRCLLWLFRKPLPVSFPLSHPIYMETGNK